MQEILAGYKKNSQWRLLSKLPGQYGISATGDNQNLARQGLQQPGVNWLCSEQEGQLGSQREGPSLDESEVLCFYVSKHIAEGSNSN